MQQPHQRGGKIHPPRPSDPHAGIFGRMFAEMAALPHSAPETDDEIRRQFEADMAAMPYSAPETEDEIRRQFKSDASQPKSGAAGAAAARAVHGTSGGKGHSTRWPDSEAGARAVHGTSGGKSHSTRWLDSEAAFCARVSAEIAEVPLWQTEEEVRLHFARDVAQDMEFRKRLEIAQNRHDAALASVATIHEKDMDQRDALLADARVAFDLDRTQRDAAHGVDLAQRDATLAQRDATLANAQVRHHKAGR